MYERQLWKGSWRLNLKKVSPWFLVAPSVFVKHLKSFFLRTVLKTQTEPTETDPVRFVHGSLDAVFCFLFFFPQAGLDGNTEDKRLWLSEQLPDLSVNVAKEVHVGGASMQTFVLHQELTEQHLWFVLLPHN